MAPRGKAPLEDEIRDLDCTIVESVASVVAVSRRPGGGWRGCRVHSGLGFAALADFGELRAGLAEVERGLAKLTTKGEQDMVVLK